ncbi:MAG TPA: DUF115 domain-containing protein [Acetivibrio sp.]|uniref:motility associated factor glycosyltransferase family protein n=1 Tax=Acetivibrio sp. TaxID=1872092 RepID=UPI002B5E32C6|nr:6-hydroxymethylpterin diphosphokinase MptE-like protein [Acetivibrio sp.]HOM01316.1 DUF115 domain-containing protein [Acetivibrio sp.]
MGDIFKLNIDALREKYPRLAEVFEYLNTEESESSVILENSKNGMPNFKVKKGEHTFFIHSAYDPQTEAVRWAERINLKGFDTIAILGVGCGYHLEELEKKYPDKNKIVIEPDKNVFLKLLNTRDITSLILNENILFIISDNTEEIGRVFLSLREEGQIDNVEFNELLSYRKVYEEWWLNLKKDYIKFSRLYQINGNTSVFFAETWLTNLFEGMWQLTKSTHIKGYKSAFTNVPAIVVSAGPALNKNIHLLKELYNKAVIISAGSSINILESRGITPHIMVGVDGGEPESRIFNNVKSDEIYFAYTLSVHYDGLKNYKGPKIYFKTNALGYENWVDNKMGVEGAECMCSGSSVSNISLDIARYMGCNPIILIGQNLSFPNMECYAEGAVLKQEQDDIIRDQIEKKTRYYIQEKDIHGNDVYTTQSMLSIRYYFEEYVRIYSDRLYLNGSEDGLPIKGMKNMPLKEIIDTYCIEEYDIKGTLDSKFKEEFEAENIEDKKAKIRTILEDIRNESSEMKEKAIKRLDLILDILSNIRGVHDDKWKEIDKLTDEIEGSDLYKYFIEPLSKYFIRAIKNERERKIESMSDMQEKLKYLYEGLLMQYAEVKDKISLIDNLSNKIIKDIDKKEESECLSML